MINKFLKRYLLVFFCIGLSACASSPSNQQQAISSTLSSSIEKYSEEYKRHPDNPASVAKLGDQYYQAYLQTQNSDYRQLALATYAEFLKLVPNNDPVKVVMYSMLIEKAISDDLTSGNEVNRFFSSYPIIKESGLAPPSYVKAAKLLKRGTNSDESELVDALKTSITDAPKFYGSYLYLFRIHSNAERHRLAEAILTRGTQAANHPFLHREMYFYTLDRANAKSTNACYIDRREGYKEALSSAKQWAKILPNDPQAHAALAESYSTLGRSRLMLEASKRANTLQKNLKNAVDTADAYLALGQASKAHDILRPLLSAKDSTLARESYSEWAFVTENWPIYISHTNQLISEGDASPYHYFRLALVYAHIGETEQANKALKTSIKPAKLNEWQSRLYTYYLGELTDDALFSFAKNICETTEAEFAVGLTAYLEGNNTQAKQYFEQIKKNKLTMFREYTSAVNLLKLIEQ